MPVIGISVKRLHTLLGTEAKAADLERLLNEYGCDVEGVANVRRFKSLHSDYVIEAAPQEALPLTDPHSGFTGDKPEDVWQQVGEEEVVRIDLLPVRPDIFDAGGMARALRGYMGLETGLKDYHAADPTWRVEVDPRITDPKFGRPLIQCAIVRNLTVDEETLRAVMKLQENLHWALCRDRKFASIGVYDLAKLENPIRYTLVNRDDFRFTPLFWGHREPVSPKVMLEEHPKGVDYAHLVEGMNELPALIAANENVLSLPPIINAEETKVTTDTRDILIDVTGHNEPVVTKALNIIATSIVELDPEGKACLERVEMVFPDGSKTTPLLEAEKFELSPEGADKLLGVGVSRDDCKSLLEKMRHSVDDPGGDKPFSVGVAPYRNDILHEWDLVEDIAIAFGYHNVKRQLVPTFTPGKSIPMNDFTRKAAEALCGLGFLETMTLVLTNERDHYDKLRRELTARRVTLQNPIHQDQTMLREHLYSSLLGTLAENTDHPLPQRIFEVGDVVTYEGVAEDEPEPMEMRHAAGAVCATRAGYAEGRSAMDSLAFEMGFGELEYRADDNPSALPGRSASVYMDGAKVGEVFEVHPEVLENYRLPNPVVLFSLTLGKAEYGD